MTASFNYQTASAPTKDEVAMWTRELQLLSHRPPNSGAVSETERRGWGFPDSLRPPPDCYEFIAANLKRTMGTRLTEPLRPELRFVLLSTLMTYFAWLRGKEGTRWLLHLYGIQVVQPHPGYAYFYENERLTEPEFGLRIYHIDSSERTLKSPVDYYGAALAGELKTLLENRRGPSQRPLPHASDSMWQWVGSFVRNWLTETKPDTTWPTTKPDRISGYLWAKGLLRPGSQSDFVWNVIGQAEVYRDQDRLYRIQKPAYLERFENGVRRKMQPDQPGVLWTDRKKMRTVPLDELDQHLGISAQDAEAKYRCKSCSRVMCCTTGSPHDRLCMNCRGTQLEHGDRPSLGWCRYRECRNCPEHLRNGDDLFNLLSRLNTSSERVRRV